MASLPKVIEVRVWNSYFNSAHEMGMWACVEFTGRPFECSQETSLKCNCEQNGWVTQSFLSADEWQKCLTEEKKSLETAAPPLKS